MDMVCINEKMVNYFIKNYKLLIFFEILGDRYEGYLTFLFQNLIFNFSNKN